MGDLYVSRFVSQYPTAVPRLMVQGILVHNKHGWVNKKDLKILTADAALAHNDNYVMTYAGGVMCVVPTSIVIQAVVAEFELHSFVVCKIYIYYNIHVYEISTQISVTVFPYSRTSSYHAGLPQPV